MRRIESMLVAAVVLSCAAPAAGGLISVNRAANPIGHDGLVICDARMSGSSGPSVIAMIASFPGVRAATSSAVWYDKGANDELPFVGTFTETGKSLSQLTELGAYTAVGRNRNTNDVMTRRPTRARAHSLDAAVDYSFLALPPARENTRTGPETYISLLGSPARG